MDEDEEEDEENSHFRSASSDGQTIQLKEDAISFDQASSSRSIQFSLWWLILFPGSAYSAAKCLAHGTCLKSFPILKTVLQLSI